MVKYFVNANELGVDEAITSVNIDNRQGFRTRQSERWTRHPQPDSREVHDHAGTDDPVTSFVFTIIGSMPELGAEVDFILDQIQGSATWTLDSDDDTLNLWRDFDRIALKTLRVEESIQRAVNSARLRVECAVKGAWNTDPGGSYDEKIAGNFTQESDGTFTDADGVNWDKKIVQLPEQESGFPLAVDSTGFDERQPSLDSTVEVSLDRGGTVNEERYDLDGFLHPSPSSTGDVGVFEIRSSPSRAYLNGDTTDFDTLTTEDGRILETEDDQEDLLATTG